MIRAAGAADEIPLAAAKQDKMDFGIPLDFDIDGRSRAGFWEDSVDKHGNQEKGFHEGTFIARWCRVESLAPALGLSTPGPSRNILATLLIPRVAGWRHFRHDEQLFSPALS